MTDEEALRAELRRSWADLDAEQVTGERRFRVATLSADVRTDEGPVAVAVDHDGHRHLLLPVPTRLHIRGGPDGPVLRLRRLPLEDEDTYQVHASLSCLRTDLVDVFTELCVDAVQEVRAAPAQPLKALRNVLDRWKSLFRQGPLLTPEQLAGLAGELLVLARLLETRPGAHTLWQGPRGHHHDFTDGVRAVEVKTGTSAGRRRPRIHGLGQLEAPPGGSLHLVWFRLQPAEGRLGTPFVSLVRKVLELCEDEHALLALLAAVGYRPQDDEQYEEVRFLVQEERWYEVGEGFPSLTAAGLTAAGVPITAQDVEYTIDLSGDVPSPLTGTAAAEVLGALVREAT